MDLAELFNPTSKKIWVAVILFLVLPNLLVGEDEYCPDPWEAYVVGEGAPCTTMAVTYFIPFYGLILLVGFFFVTDSVGVSYLSLGLPPEMWPSLIIQIIMAYVASCIVVAFILKPKAPPAKKAPPAQKAPAVQKAPPAQKAKK